MCDEALMIGASSSLVVVLFALTACVSEGRRVKKQFQQLPKSTKYNMSRAQQLRISGASKKGASSLAARQK